MKASAFAILLIFPICLAVADDAFSQQTKIDTATINANLQLGNTYLDDQPDKGARYAYDALLRA